MTDVSGNDMNDGSVQSIEVMNSNNSNIDFRARIQYKRERFEAHNEPNKVCVIIPSASSAYVMTQVKIMELIDKKDMTQLYYGGYDETKEMIFRLIENREYEFEYEDCKMTAMIEQVTPDMGIQFGIDNVSYLFVRADNQDVMKRFLNDTLIKKPERKIYQYSTENGSWRTVGTLKERDPSTLILKEGVLEELMEDLDDYIKSQKDYNKFGIPFKKVYLFHGEPGTGKTSLSQIMANRVDRSLYILNFDPKMTDDDLSSAIRHIDAKGGILLLEDIDCLFKARNTNQNLTSISFSSLLNNLDGAIQNVGLITIITTNHPDLLDSALRRPLRVDKTIKFEKANEHQIQKLLELYDITLKSRTIDKIVNMANNSNLCPAGISGFLFRNRRKEITDKNIIDLFKEYLDEIKIEEYDKETRENMYV